MVAGLLMMATPAQAQVDRRQLIATAPQFMHLTPDVASQYNIAPLKAPRHSGGITEDILLEEDFSGFATGTYEQPDTSRLLASQYYAPGKLIDPSLTHGMTWAGNNVYPAGGAAYVWTPNPTNPAYLCTPLGDYSGDVTVTVRVKAMPAWVAREYDEDGNIVWGRLNGTTFSVIPLIGGFDKPDNPNTDLESHRYSVQMYEDKGWSKITVTFKNYSADNDGHIMFRVIGAALIDDVQVTAQLTDFLASPKVLGVTDFQENQFTVQWDRVRKANGYYLDLYKKVYTADGDGQYSEDFENFTELQQGWQATTTELCDEGSEGSKGLLLHQGDTLTLPNNGGTYKNLTFFLRTDDPEADKDSRMWKFFFPGSIAVEVLNNNEWTKLGYFEAVGYVEQGGMVDMSEQMEGFADKFKAVRFYPEDFSETEYMVIDDVNLTTNRPSKIVTVKDGKDINDLMDENYNYWEFTSTGVETEYTFTGLDPETDYYYGVRAHYIQQFSPRIAYHAMGVATPRVLPATDIDSRGSFTANWEKAPKATGYQVNLYGVYHAAEDEANHILLEENFDAINSEVTAATDVTKPESVGNYSETSFDDYTTLPGWTGTSNSIVQGMLGCKDTRGGNSYLQTPAIDVSHDYYVTLTLKAYGTAGDNISLKIDDQTYLVPFDAQGVIDDSYYLPVGNAKTIRPVIGSSDGKNFVIDYICFAQNLKKGDYVHTPLFSETTTELSYTFSNLSDYDFEWFGYDVCSLFALEGESAVSKKSDLMLVDLENGTSQSGIANATTSNGQQNVEAIYSVDSRQQQAMQKGLNIVKMSDGSVRKLLVK